MFIDKTLDGSQKNKDAITARVTRINPEQGKRVEGQTNDAIICDMLDADGAVIHKNAAFSGDELPFEWADKDAADLAFSKKKASLEEEITAIESTVNYYSEAMPDIEKRWEDAHAAFELALANIGASEQEEITAKDLLVLKATVNRTNKYQVEMSDYLKRSKNRQEKAVVTLEQIKNEYELLVNPTDKD